MIKREEILKGQTCPPEYEGNLQILLDRLNAFRQVYGKPMIVTSGLRSADHNLLIGGKPGSAHLTAQAADFEDHSRELSQYCLAHQDLLEAVGLWMENPAYTPTWVHLQVRPAKNRIFIP